MTTPTHSYRKVNYDLRPAKQIERRMMIDTFQILAKAGFPIRDYQYTGFGSIYFVDFILLHKLLGLRAMRSVEHDPDAFKRCKFNKPFGDDVIDLELDSASNIIPTLDRNRPHILWLDYDYPLDSEILADSRSATASLSPGSILVVTVEGGPPKIKKKGPAALFRHFAEQGGAYLDAAWTQRNFTKDNLQASLIYMVNKAILSGLYGRHGISFCQVFNFLYKDGKQMLTLGGMIAGAAEKKKLENCDFSKATYVRRSLNEEPYEIFVPRLTRKERLYLDSFMPAPESWRPKKFPLLKEELRAYRDIYRFFPAYAEMLLG